MNTLRNRSLLAVAALVALAALVVAGATARQQAAAPSHVTIGYQPGIGYAPLIVLKTQKTLERQFPARRSRGSCSRRAPRSRAASSPGTSRSAPAAPAR